MVCLRHVRGQFHIADLPRNTHEPCSRDTMFVCLPCGQTGLCCKRFFQHWCRIDKYFHLAPKRGDHPSGQPFQAFPDQIVISLFRV